MSLVADRAQGEGARAWFCLRAQPKHEHIATANLRKNLQLEVFHPRLSIERATRRGVVRVSEPLFSCYIFIRCDIERSLNEIQRTNGIGTVDGLKYLRSLPIADLNNVGMIGMSMGGLAIDSAALIVPDGYKSMFFMDSACFICAPTEKNFAMSIGQNTELPGFTAASTWMRPWSNAPLLGSWKERFSPETIPALIEP